MAIFLLTSTQKVSEALALKLGVLGHESVIMPLLEVQPISYLEPDHPPSAILITSRHALTAAQKYMGTPLYVVGQQTALMARAQGHLIAHMANTVDLIKDRLPDDTMYLRGQEVSQELKLLERVCYAAKLIEPSSPPPAHDAVILMSARAAPYMPQTTQPIFCFSTRIQNALPEAMQAQAIVPDTPTEIALLEEIKHWSAHQ